MPGEPDQTDATRPPPASAPPHPCPRADPRDFHDADHRDRERYREPWWQSTTPPLWQPALIAIAILLGLWLLRNVVGPMLSPTTP